MGPVRIRRRFTAVKWLIRGVLGAVGLLVIALTGALYLLERGGVPQAWLNHWIQAAVPNGQARVEVDRACFSLLAGVRAEGLRVWLPGGEDQPQFSCETLRAGIDWFSNGPLVGCVRSISAEGLYITARFPQGEGGEASAPPRPIRFPAGLDVRLKLTGSDIVDIHLDRLEGRLHSDDLGRLRLSGAEAILAEASGRAPQQFIRGDAWLNLVDSSVGGTVTARLDPPRINGLFTVLRLEDVKAYIAAFELKDPVSAACTFEAGLQAAANLCNVRVSVETAACTYRAVPLAALQGALTVEGARDCLLTIGPLEATHADSSRLAGTLVFDFASDTLQFDARSAFPLPDLYALIDQPFTRQIPEMAFNKGPEVVMNGFVPLNGDPALVRLNGTVSVVGGGHVLKLPFETAAATLTMAGGTLVLDSAQAALRAGGTLNGTFALTFPADPARRTETDFQSQATLGHAELADLMLPFISEKNLLSESGSKVNAAFTLGGTFRDTPANTLASLNGAGSGTLTGGHLNRFHLFAGLTDLLANNIPGFASLTDQSSAKSAFTISNGIYKTERLEITGDILSIEGHGTYSLPEDDLNFAIIVAIFTKESILGNITRWVTVPVARFLMEFEMRGPIGEPRWSRKGTIRKITDIF